MKRARWPIKVLACFLLVVQFCHGWKSTSSCGEGTEETPHNRPTSPIFQGSPTTPSTSTSTSTSRSLSSSGSTDGSDSCECSSPATLVPISSSADATSGSFEDTASDIARQLYDRYNAGDQVERTTLNAVPEAVRTRLANLSLTFEDLPGLMQRAVLWDSGFAVSSNGSVLQVWTLHGRSMAEIAVSADEFNSTGCEAMSCTQENSEVAQYSTCRQGPVQMLAASTCIVEAFDSSENSNETMWAAGSDSSSIPEIRVVRSSGTTSCGCEYTVYSIHTASLSEQDSATTECPPAASLTIPCYGNDSIPDSIKARATVPTGSDWVTGWILEHFRSSATSESSGSASQGSPSTTTETGKEDGGGFSLWWLLLILLILLLLIIATIVACRHCHRLSRFNSPPDNTTYIFVGGRMWAVEDESHGRGAGYWLRFANWCRKTFNFFE
jgi:hypothetical protein